MPIPKQDLSKYQQKYQSIFPELNERTKRHVAAADAKLLGYGGVAFVHHASGLSRTTIRRGAKELGSTLSDDGRIRSKGGGRKKLRDTDAALYADLTTLIDPATRGDPMSPLRWVSKSSRHIAKALRASGHRISHTTVRRLLKQSHYSLQSNVKSKEDYGKTMTEAQRDEQFQYISDTAKAYLEAGDPVISVDTKKKELVGEYKNPGKEWLPKGKPHLVASHDFGDKDENGVVMKAIPYGVYDPYANMGYVNVGITHDTSEFAVHSIRSWWQELGKERYPTAKQLLITPDAGGSNGYRVRLWKKVLQDFADESGLAITVCHFPRGTSKWNKIEHRLFSFITDNWKGQPLLSYQMVVSLIAATTTETGLKVYASLDEAHYEIKKQVSDEAMAALNITPHELNPQLNYTIAPITSPKES